ncbi:hypothetical protein [Pseudomonas asplenii]|uniref:hypothetical protein n=1 Tax=Pseudomonas asplenii TaxID=53407 RepID=UPI0003687B3A|nr:hypothetical protein [Pseudomonas fuscovaginae]
MPRPSDIQLKRNQLARLKANLDDCAQRLADPLDVDDPHTRILRANALAHRLGLGQLIARGGDDKARHIKELAQLPDLSAIHAFRKSDPAPLRVGKIAKSDEQSYSEMVSEFSEGLIELNALEANEDEELSTPDSIASLIESAPRIGRPAKSPLESLDRGLAENFGTARLALAKAMINEETPRVMGRPARTVAQVNEEYDQRKSELEKSIQDLESKLQGVEIHDRATKIYRDVLAQFKRLVKEVGGPDQVAAKAEVARLESHLKFLKADRKKYLEAGEPDLPLEHHNSPRYHLAEAKSEQAGVRYIYDEVTLPREIKRFKETEAAAKKAKASKK